VLYSILTLLANALELTCRIDLSEEEFLKVKVNKKEDLKKKRKKKTRSSCY
jgi:hypothetical protein